MGNLEEVRAESEESGAESEESGAEPEESARGSGGERARNLRRAAT